MIITITDNLRLKGVPGELKQALLEKLEFPNPKWVENERMGRWNRGTPRVLTFYDKVGADGLWIPRGYLRQLILTCRQMGVEHRIEDRRRRLPPPRAESTPPVAEPPRYCGWLHAGRPDPRPPTSVSAVDWVWPIPEAA